MDYNRPFLDDFKLIICDNWSALHILILVLCLDVHISDSEENYFSDENDQDIDSESNEDTDDSFVQDSNVDEVEDEVDENENDEEGIDDLSDEWPELIPIWFQGNAGQTFNET